MPGTVLGIPETGPGEILKGDKEMKELIRKITRASGRISDIILLTAVLSFFIDFPDRKKFPRFPEATPDILDAQAAR